MNPNSSASTVLGIGIAVMLLLSGGTISTTGESTNQTSNISKESIATSMLDRELIPENQLLTEEDSNITQGIAKTVTPKYKVKVTFDYIIITNDLDGTDTGSVFDRVGEYDLSAYVQGKRVDLTGGTGYSCSVFDFETHSPIAKWCERLYDADTGEKITFNPGTEVTVEMPQDVPLSIFTTGLEIDDCGRVNWPKDDDPKLEELVSLLNEPNEPGFVKDKIKAFRNYIITKNDDCGILHPDPNDPISTGYREPYLYYPIKYGRFPS
jgi:hypothetical protein